jgi:hypothetical protein
MSVVEGDKVRRMTLRTAYLDDPAAPIAHPDRTTVHPYPVTKLRLHSCHLHPESRHAARVPEAQSCAHRAATEPLAACYVVGLAQDFRTRLPS